MKLQILKVIQDRRSVRKFSSKPVERRKILTCIEAARLAPSAENVQPWRFIIVDDPDIKSAFGKVAFSGIYRATQWALKAPVIVVLLAQLDLVAHRIGGVIQNIPFYLLDLGIAGEHFVLQAQEMGLGTCWIGWFDVRKTRKFFNIPRSMRVCQLLAVGYPDASWQWRPHRRKPCNDFVSFNQWK